MKILFCGTMVPEETEYQVKDISAAGNRFQNNMIRNFKRAGYEVVSCSFLGMNIPDGVKKQLRGNYVFRDSGLLKGIWEYYRLLKRTMSDMEMVICYNIVYAWLILPIMAKRRSKRSIVIVADYSERISYRNISGKIYASLQLWSMQRFDTVVGLSGNIKDKLRVKQQFILMEGGIDEELYNAFSYKPHETGAPIIFMYSGLLSHVTGVNLLLDAIKQMDRQNIRLWISGKGELEDLVRTVAKVDNRIRFLGHLPYEEYIRRLQRVDVLINPRDMSLPENQNNFPSKIMDYLASGKVILSTKFAGWEQFEDNIVFCESSTEGIGNSMESIADKSIDEKKVFCTNREKAKQFEWRIQLKKIFEQI